MSTYADHDVPIIERGEGPYVWDSKGKRYLDGLSGLFVVQAGHGRQELADAARQAGRRSSPTSRCGPTPTRPRSSWPSGSPSYAPGDLNRVFFTTGGGEAVESAWKLARQYFKVIGEPGRYKVISRDIAYHGTTMGALSITGVPRSRTPSSRWSPAASACRTPTSTAPPSTATTSTRFGQWAADEIERAILREGPESVAAVFLEPRAELRRLLPAAARLLRTGSARSATSTASCSSATR